MNAQPHINSDAKEGLPPSASVRKKHWTRTSVGILFILACVIGAVYFHFDKERHVLDPEIRAAFPGQYTELSDGITHYDLAGPEDGDVVVLVHGLSVPYYVWDPTFSFLTDAGFRVLRYDQYGRGYSDRPKTQYDAGLFVRQLAELIQAVEIRKPVHLVGLSLGGPIAAAYAARFPKRVKSVSLVSPQVKPDTQKDISPLHLPLIGELVIAAYVVPIMMPQKVTEAFHEPDWFPEWEGQFREQIQFKGFRRAMLSTIRNLVGMDPRGFYQKVHKHKLPGMVIWGKEERVIAKADAETLVRLYPGIRSYTIAEAGHLPHYEKPEDVNPLLVEFFRKTD